LFPVGEVYSVGEDPKDEEQAEPGVQLGVAQQARHHVSKNLNHYYKRRWKSQGIKIHMLGYRFLRFLNPYGFLYGNHKHLAKFSDFWFTDFFLKFLKSIGWYVFSHRF
jgi:hypothetical protein